MVFRYWQAIAWCCMALFLQTNTVSAEFFNMRTSSPLSLTEFPTAVLKDWIVVRSEEGEEVEFLGQQVQLSPGAIAIAGTNSELAFFAVLAHSISIGTDVVAEPGTVLLLGHSFGSGLSVQPFDAQDFFGRLRRLGADDLADTLLPVAESQQRKIFWGLLRPSEINVNKPYNIVFEQGRRKYTLHPVLLQIKRESRSEDELATNTANAFVTALREGDVESTAALLSPVMFQEQGRTPYSNDEWINRRLRFARMLCDKTQSREISRVGGRTERGHFLFTMEENEYLLKLQVFDGSYFIEEIAQRNL